MANKTKPKSRGIKNRAVDQAEAVEARLRREVARYQLDLTKARRKVAAAQRRSIALSTHAAAERNRFTNDWYAPSTSADSEILADLPLITARSRQLVRDDAYAKSIVRSFIRNIVGTGITPSLNEKPDTPNYRPYAVPWKRWSASRSDVDREGRMNLMRVQRWSVSELVTAGEAFVVRWVLPGDATSPPRLRLQRFESEQLDRYKLRDENTGNDVRAGVEVDANNRPVAYHFYERHPHDVAGLSRPTPLRLRSMRVPAHMVSHIYDPDRVIQSRGVSRLHPVIRKIRDLSEYDATQLRVARAEAALAILLKGSPLDPDGNPENPLYVDGLQVAYLADDESITPFAPSRPGRDYDPFVKAQLHAIAAGVGISYEQIARDLRGTTYSGGRQGAIDDRREWLPLIQIIIDELCIPVFADWLAVWAAQNQDDAGDYYLDPEAHVPNWQGQGWDWVDPESQGKAIERKFMLGLTTRTREASLLGTSIHELDAEAQIDGTAGIVDRLLKRTDNREAPQPAAAPDAPGAIDAPLETADAADSD